VGQNDRFGGAGDSQCTRRSGSDIGSGNGGQLVFSAGLLWPEAFDCFLSQRSEQRSSLSLGGRGASKLLISFYVPMIEKPVQIESVHIHSSALRP
jgi:hypothetical protein